MSYLTQLHAARMGMVTKEMQDVLRKEQISEKQLIEKVSCGKIVIPANKNHKNLEGIGIGEGLKTKVNVNLGVSEDCYNVHMEFKKVELALKLGTDSIMDLSSYGDTRKFRRRLIEKSPVIIGTVPVYDAVVRYDKPISEITIDEFFQVVKDHAEDGVDFMTIHAGLTRAAAETILKNQRLTHVVSRGGSILLEWMVANDRENPFYEYFDRLLEICKKYDITLSLGDGLRPGSLNDATDAPQIHELIIMGELTRLAWSEDVQVIIEGPGHVPLNEIVANVQLEKKLCHGAPFYVLGPLVTDVTPGYDHITSAIGGSIAASAGADFLCYVTPAEHLRLPDLSDMKEGLIATKIAAHAADISKNIPGAMEWDYQMSKARDELDWKEMFRLAIDPEKAREYRESVGLLDSEVCSMCGELCAVKRSRNVFETHIGSSALSKSENTGFLTK